MNFHFEKTLLIFVWVALALSAERVQGVALTPDKIVVKSFRAPCNRGVGFTRCQLATLKDGRVFIVHSDFGGDKPLVATLWSPSGSLLQTLRFGRKYMDATAIHLLDCGSRVKIIVRTYLDRFEVYQATFTNTAFAVSLQTVVAPIMWGDGLRDFHQFGAIYCNDRLWIVVADSPRDTTWDDATRLPVITLKFARLNKDRLVLVTKRRFADPPNRGCPVSVALQGIDVIVAVTGHEAILCDTVQGTTSHKLLNHTPDGPSYYVVGHGQAPDQRIPLMAVWKKHENQTSGAVGFFDDNAELFSVPLGSEVRTWYEDLKYTSDGKFILSHVAYTRQYIDGFERGMHQLEFSFLGMRTIEVSMKKAQP